MFKLEELKKKTINELKNIAKEQKIKLDAKLKKDDIIKMILQNEMTIETSEKKKEEIKEFSSSYVSTQQVYYEPKKDNLNNGNDLPGKYNKDKLVFLVRDPKWGFVYWEISEEMKNNHKLNENEKFLRCYDITGARSPENSNFSFDIKINDLANNWYINFPEANKTFIIDYGYFKDGKFITLIRSNAATLPRDDISDKIDLEWMLPDDLYQYLLKASGADQLFQQIGSQELMKFLAVNVNESVTSGMPSSVSSPFGASFGK